MRKIIVLSFVSPDGIIQAPGGSEEDPSNGFIFVNYTRAGDVKLGTVGA